MARVDVSEVRPLVEKAFHTQEPLLTVHDVLQKLVSRGYSIQLLLDDLRTFREELRASHQEDLEDFVVDALDMLTGYVSPHLKVHP